MLQGPIGPFFADLQRALTAAGHSAHRIHFNGGDRVYGGIGAASDFRGPLSAWPTFLSMIVDREACTDLVLFGDCRPLHRLAIDCVRSRGLRIHVFEEGYLRPGWITLEENGVNGYSMLSKEPAAFGSNAEDFRPPCAVPGSYPRRAAEDVLYTLATTLLARRYRHYRSHKPWHPLAEYRAGARRFFGNTARRARAAHLAQALLDRGQRFFLFSLQLDSDAQIRVHSPFGRMQAAIETVIASFATGAPTELQLVFSEHPLDQAVIDLQPIVARCAAAAGIVPRVTYLHGGTPPGLLEACVGLVTVNSTLGLSALASGRPVAVLGQAVYGIPGLVHAGPLDAFWADPQPPDERLFAAFRQMLIERTQLRGGFYGPEARQLAVVGAVSRLLRSWPQPDGASEPEPMLAAEGLGIE